MSHFSCWVIGDNVKEQLEPFNEQDEKKRNWQLIHLDELVKELKLENYSALWRHIRSVNQKDEPLLIATEKLIFDKKHKDQLSDWIIEYQGEYGNNILVADEWGKVVGAFQIRNGGKWDWWVVGGRWMGSLLIKDLLTELQKERFQKPDEENYVKYNLPLNPMEYDVLPKKHIDFDALRATQLAEKGWGRLHRYGRAIINGRFWVSWDQCWLFWDVLRFILAYWWGWDNKQIGDSGLFEKLRTMYHDQPVIQDLKRFEESTPEIGYSGLEKDILSIEDEEDFLLVTENLWLPGSFVIHGQWYERGEMGWFGCRHNEIDRAVWTKQALQLLAEVAEDDLITVVDCHV